MRITVILSLLLASCSAQIEELKQEGLYKSEKTPEVIKSEEELDNLQEKRANVISDYNANINLIDKRMRELERKISPKLYLTKKEVDNCQKTIEVIEKSLAMKKLNPENKSICLSFVIDGKLFMVYNDSNNRQPDDWFIAEDYSFLNK